MKPTDLVEKLYASAGETCVISPDVAHIEIHGNEVVGLHNVPGLEVDTEEQPDGVRVAIKVLDGTRIAQPVRLCFGLLPDRGRQLIDMQVDIGEGASMAALALCTFPNAVEVEHLMEAEIRIRRGGQYHYLERHVHSDQGGLKVVPHARITLEEGSRFRTDFELLRGRVGNLDIDYRATAGDRATLELSARISARGDDRVVIHEQANLTGIKSRGVLLTNIAVRDSAHAMVKNTLVAAGAHSRGHVDCKEVVTGDAVASAIPEVEVRNPSAHVTHEAAIGAVDQKQLETLMSRGLTEEAATELIIEGLLSPEATMAIIDASGGGR